MIFLKSKIIIMILVLSLLISIGFNIYFITSKSKDHTQQIINDSIYSELSLLSGNLENLQENDNLRFISSTTGAIFWLSFSSNNIDNDTKHLFQELNNFFVNSSINEIYKNRTELSKLIKFLSNTPNNKDVKEKLRNLIGNLK